MTIAIATEMVQVVAPADLQAGKFARGQTTKRGRQHRHRNIARTGYSSCVASM
jgi:hypothetical protein